MNRREFLAAGVAVSTTASLVRAQEPASESPAATEAPAGGERRFRLAYAPHFGMFKHHAGNDLIDQLKFMADEGFAALEDNGMKGRPVEDQNMIAAEMAKRGMRMGVFVATGSFSDPTFASGNKDFAQKAMQDVRDSVEVAKRVDAKWVTVVPGTFEHRLQLDYQTANVIELLKRCAAICEPHGLVMVLEPLNHYVNHPELFLHRSPQARLLCKAVDSPSCKILFDVYHQQVSEGNLINNIEHCWDEIAYFQIGDNPGRKEPGTGEINYRNVFKFIHSRGFDGILGMEHGNSLPDKAGETAVIEAYIEADRF
ncbi:MAG: TIM barrel protein [Planctomycetaceae bacterium]